MANRSPRVTPRIETLEDRRLLATYLVTDPGDSGPGTLRDAIHSLNVQGDPANTINFAIVGGAPIQILSDLESITRPVVINGGGSLTTPPTVRLRPDPMGFAFNGLHLIGGDSIIEHITVSGFLGNGIWLEGNNNIVRSCYVGTTDDGMGQTGNEFGIFISSGSNNTIGGSGTGIGNLISGNRSDGISVQTGSNQIAGNFIGTNKDGTAAIANGLGIAVFAGSDNTIGGTAVGERNIISGNGTGGVQIGSGATGNVIRNNYIGTDPTGTAALPNTGPGIEFVSGANGNTVGGLNAADRNVISGNTNTGISITTSNDNLILGNYVGLTFMGDQALPNGIGIAINQGSTNTVGGTASGARNIISGNSNTGLSLSGTGNKVLGNYIGTDPTGLLPIGNSLVGVAVTGGFNNVIGGTLPEESNVISGNHNPTPGLITGTGLLITGGATNTLVEGNFIGTDKTGTALLQGGVGNDVAGVMISGGASFNTIGGTVTEMRNIISGNRGPDDQGIGVEIIGAGTNNNLIANDYIGTDVGGTVALANGRGVTISFGASNNTVGDDTPRGATIATGRRNIISGNVNAGIAIFDRTTSNNFVVGNYIGTQVGGTLALGNGEGVDIYGAASFNRIGGFIAPNPSAGTATAADMHGNLIDANLREGVRIYDFDTSNNLVQGNMIGVYVFNNQTFPLGNDVGVAFAGFSSNNYVGGTVVTRHNPPDPDEFLPAGNLISGNRTYGVAFFDRRTFGNHVESNLIGPDKDGLRPVVDPVTGLLVQKDGAAFYGGATGNFLGGTLGGTVASYTRNVISGNRENGVILFGSDTTGNVVRGNFIGTNVNGTDILHSDDGTVNVANGLNGVRLYYSANGNVIGGVVAIGDPSEPGPRNVIAGHPNDGILLDSDAHDNQIMGNFIGTDATGLAALPNAANGVELRLALDNTIPPHDNTIGGTAAGAGNLISANALDGILISMGSHDNKVYGNAIGLDRTAFNVPRDFNASLTTLGNGLNGVHVQDLGSDHNVIGGTVARDPITNAPVFTGQGNAIGFNTLDGVLIDTGVQNTLLQNAIARNGSGLGIDLMNGGNNNLANPVRLSSVTVDTVNFRIVITGSIPVTLDPDMDYIVDFFIRYEPASGPNAGEVPLNFGVQPFVLVIHTDASGNAVLEDAPGSGSVTFPFALPYVARMFVTTTFTDDMGNTSPYSDSTTEFEIAPYTAPGGGDPGVSPNPVGAGTVLPVAGVTFQDATLQLLAGAPTTHRTTTQPADLFFHSLAPHFRHDLDLTGLTAWDSVLDRTADLG